MLREACPTLSNSAKHAHERREMERVVRLSKREDVTECSGLPSRCSMKNAHSTCPLLLPIPCPSSSSTKGDQTRIWAAAHRRAPTYMNRAMSMLIIHLGKQASKEALGLDLRWRDRYRYSSCRYPPSSWTKVD